VNERRLEEPRILSFVGLIEIDVKA